MDSAVKVPFLKGGTTVFAIFDDAGDVWKAEVGGQSIVRYEWLDLLRWFDDNGWICQAKLCGRDRG